MDLMTVLFPLATIDIGPSYINMILILIKPPSVK